MTTTRCEHCPHEWHGLRCSHEAVVRTGWSMVRETCSCAHSRLPGSD
ncbi:hypothetical protein SAMN04488570_3661 [Nocardioides scoriae]|uniref:Uncharacterized protein n=1 Tax=Nocardioides scoriae TaxID=642780 RepID=A0A1H1XZV4_9ACTN|nr:hypothetical protein [Nocardioides scoriae]SDT14702.1 hypothetical protein SAMN04488570_3661 [Nocardioides scoriae]